MNRRQSGYRSGLFANCSRRLSVALQGVVCAAVIAAGCAGPLPKGTSGTIRSADGEIADLLQLPQRLFPYADAAGERLTMAGGCRSALLAEFRKHFYAPWTDASQFDSSESREFMEKVARADWFGVNRRPMPSAMLRGILANCALETFPSRNEKAIAIVPSHLRGLPTHLPLFTAANDYPFDMLQYPQVKANEPLRVLHTSRDGVWLFVESAYSNGWLEARDVAFVEQRFIDAWMALPQLVIIRDDVAIKGGPDAASYRAGMGTFMPVKGEGETWWEVETASVGEGRKAMAGVTRISRGEGRRFPISFDQEGVALIGDQLIGQPYGWGEMYGLRDCSAMLRDFFLPFGIWLPRTAADQIASVPKRLDLSGKAPEDKEEAIRREGVPFLTLFYKPGHIMLFVGTDLAGRPLVFHNAWSVRVRDAGGERSQLIGKGVITTLEPGKEKGLVEGGSLLEKITLLATVTDRCQGGEGVLLRDKPGVLPVYPGGDADQRMKR